MAGIYKKNPYKRIRQSRESLIAEREAEGRRAPLWKPIKEGRSVTFGNVEQDVRGIISDTMKGTRPLLSFKRRFNRYVDQGPEIDKPVPLTPNPFRKRRKQ